MKIRCLFAKRNNTLEKLNIRSLSKRGGSCIINVNNTLSGYKSIVLEKVTNSLSEYLYPGSLATLDTRFLVIFQHFGVFRIEF